MDKIKPCPFCGGEATVGTIPIVGGGYLYAFVECLSETCNGSSGQHDTETEAIAAWNRRAQPENKPLTLDEMNALNHEPIYILHMDGHGKWSMNGWHIATASSYRNHGRCDLEIDNGNTIIDMQNYGKTWLAYRAKPKEEHHEAD